jgi:hypothetical protein
MTNLGRKPLIETAPVSSPQSRATDEDAGCPTPGFSDLGHAPHREASSSSFSLPKATRSPRPSRYWRRTKPNPSTTASAPACSAPRSTATGPANSTTPNASAAYAKNRSLPQTWVLHLWRRQRQESMILTNFTVSPSEARRSRGTCRLLIRRNLLRTKHKVPVLRPTPYSPHPIPYQESPAPPLYSPHSPSATSQPPLVSRRIYLRRRNPPPRSPIRRPCCSSPGRGYRAAAV